MNEQNETSRAALRETPTGVYDLVVAGFCALLLIANVAASKLIALGPTWTPLGIHVFPLVFDGGALTFPLTYILGDCLAEVYGFKKARRAIFMGFVVSAVAALVFFIVGVLPPDPSWGNQEAWISVMGVVLRIVIGSLVGYLVGQLLNAKILVKLRDRAKPGSLWFRLISSTVVGEAADTILFCTIAWAFIVDWGTLGNYIVVGYLYKVGLEVLLLPLTLLIIPWLKRREVRVLQ
ncbi:MAG: queuosine precursor transporter [Propionibacteriaceae bacterium]|nr:queuosine precursor transporter [Propionibacteriaceae bacterium]